MRVIWTLYQSQHILECEIHVTRWAIRMNATSWTGQWNGAMDLMVNNTNIDRAHKAQEKTQPRRSRARKTAKQVPFPRTSNPSALIAWITRRKTSTFHILHKSRERNNWGHARNVLLITHSKKRYEEEWRTKSRVRKLSRNDNNKSYCKLSSDQNALCVSCSMEEIKRIKEELKWNYIITSYSPQSYTRGVKKGSDFESYDLAVLPRHICPRGTPQLCTWRMSPMILGTHRIVHILRVAQGGN